MSLQLICPCIQTTISCLNSLDMFSGCHSNTIVYICCFHNRCWDMHSECNINMGKSNEFYLNNLWIKIGSILSLSVQQSCTYTVYLYVCLIFIHNKWSQQSSGLLWALSHIFKRTCTVYNQRESVNYCVVQRIIIYNCCNKLQACLLLIHGHAICRSFLCKSSSGMAHERKCGLIFHLLLL